jgi:PAS domain S-box-containing protein
MNINLEQENKYLFYSIPFPLIILDKETYNVLQVNQAASQLFGYSHEEFLRLNAKDLISETVPGSGTFIFWQNNFNNTVPGIFHRKKNGTHILLDIKSTEIIFENKPAVLKTVIRSESNSFNDNLKLLYSAIIESSDDYILCKNLDGIILTWNKGAERIFGYKAEEVIGKHVSIIAPPDKKREIDEIMIKLRKGEKIDHYETRRMKKNGEIIWTSVTVSPVKNSDGDIIGASAIGQDITKRREDVSRLKESQIIFKHLIENLSEVFYVSDPRRPQIIYMSEAYEKVFGESLDTIYSNPTAYLGYVVEEDRNKTFRALSTQMHGISTDTTFKIKRKDGKIRYLHERAFPVKDESGEVFRVIGVAEDITERIESGEELRKSEYRYRSIFESNAVSIWEMDYSGVFRLLDELKGQNIEDYRKYFSEHREFVQRCLDTVKVIDVNPQTVELFKAENKEQFIENFNKVRTIESSPSFVDLLVVLANGGRQYESEFELQTFKGEPLYVYSFLNFPDQDNPSRYTVSSLIDITQRKMAVRALSESEQRFRIMADTAPVFIWITGPDKGFYYFNKPWLVFRGKLISEEIGGDWMEGIHPMDLPAFKKTFDAAFDSLKEFSAEFRLKRFDGEYRWILSHGVPRFSSDGVFQGYIGSGMDITLRKRNEVEISKALAGEKQALSHAAQVQKKLEFLAEASNILNSSLDYTETIQSLAKLLTPTVCDWFAVDLMENDKIKRLLVYHKDPDKRRFVEDLQKKYPPDVNDRSGVPQVIRSGKPELHSILTEDFLRKSIKDNELYDIFIGLGIKSVMIVPLIIRDKIFGSLTLCTAESGKHYDEDDLKFAGDIAYRAAMAIENSGLFRRIEVLNRKLVDTIRMQKDEIKIRKGIEKELRESEERFRMISEYTNDFISLLDENDLYLYTNPAFFSALGYNTEELVGKMTPADLVHKDDRPLLKTYRDHSVIEMRYKRKDGEFIWVESSSLKLQYHGKPVTIKISRDITERKRIEIERTRLYAQLDAQRLRLDNLLANVPGVVWEAWGDPSTPAQKLDFVSDYVEKLLGYPVKDWLTIPNFWSNIIHPDDRENAISDAKNKFINKQAGINRFRWIANDGRAVWIETQSTCIFDGSGNVIGMRGVSMDISEQIKYEQEINASLKEKEILLKEVHHRVKNNMQVITSLLSLQAKVISDKHVQQIFDENRDRIRSMALIHEKLYQSNNVYRIDFSNYVEDLINNLIISYGISKNKIAVGINIKNVSLDIDSALTLGLIINELASNSFKHAFKGQTRGNLEVSIHKDNGNYQLTIKDNGIGIPENLDIKKSESLGLQLVDTLIDQIYGSYEISGNGGTVVNINFPDPESKQSPSDN